MTLLTTAEKVRKTSLFQTPLPALQDVRETLAATWGLRTVQVRAQAHLSAGFALGFVFQSPSGFPLAIHQKMADQQEQIWRSDASPAETEPLIINIQEGTVGSPDLAVELSITSDVAAAVDRFVQTNNVSFRARIVMRPREGAGRETVADNAQAVAIARQAVNALRRLRDERGTQRIHLFAALPLGLAVLLGRQLNACGPI